MKIIHLYSNFLKVKFYCMLCKNKKIRSVRRIWTLTFQGCSHINKQFCLQKIELVDCSVLSPKLLEFLTVIINCYWRINILKTVGKIIWSPQRWFSAVCLTTNLWMAQSGCQTLFHQMVTSTSNMCGFGKSVNTMRM